jgi:6-phosphogluconolactonase
LQAYRLVAETAPFAGPRQVLFLSDERREPADSPRNNFHQISPLFAAVGCPPERCLRVPTVLPAPAAAEAYHQSLDAFFADGGRIPVGLLGLGADGHTASLFTAEHVARDAGRWATWVQRPDGMEGISVTPALLRRVERLVFVVAGAGKREMVGRLLRQPDTIAAGLAVRDCPAVELWVDAAAAPLTPQ